mmetsp:Transcript_44321/g.111396  ORF Transcript_44321/g.111396 Transcript_44321/m.111396 type:complete len:209 (+) Transcript_44321:232-858(+)
MASHSINGALLDLPFTDELGQLHELSIAARHLDIKATRCGLHCVMRCAPVTHNETPEPSILTQQLLQQLAVFAGVLAIDLVIGAHHSTSSRIHGCFEWRHVDLMLRTVTNLHVHRHPTDLLVIVQPMLDGRNDALALDRLDKRLHELAAQEGVLSRERLKAPTSAGDPCDLQVWAQKHVRALAHKLLHNRSSVLPGGVRIETGSHREQ